MEKVNKEIIIILLIVIVVAAAVTEFFINRIQKEKPEENETFYADIVSITGNSILVKGLEINDINYRSQYSFSVKDTTVLQWRNTEITLSELKIGNRVSITFNGPILETYPAQLTNVIKIQLLNDEKSGNNTNDFEIVDETEICADALELFYEDDNYRYYFNCIRSATTFVTFNDGRKYTIKEAVNNNILSIKDIEEEIKGTDKESLIYKVLK